MTFNISMLAGAGWQFFDNSGVILSGGLLYTYAAGTTTPQTAYTSSSGSTAHTNPIVLDSAGRVSSAGEIWLTDAVAYKFVLKTSTGTTIGTYDNVTGNASGIANAIYSTFAASSGSSLIGYQPAGTGAVATTVQTKLRESVSVFDFMTPEQIADVKAGTPTLNVSLAINTALASANVLGATLKIPYGNYGVNSTIFQYANQQVVCDNSTFTALTNGMSMWTIGGGTSFAKGRFQGATLNGNNKAAIGITQGGASPITNICVGFVMESVAVQSCTTANIQTLNNYWNNTYINVFSSLSPYGFIHYGGDNAGENISFYNCAFYSCTNGFLARNPGAGGQSIFMYGVSFDYNTSWSIQNGTSVIDGCVMSLHGCHVEAAQNYILNYGNMTSSGCFHTNGSNSGTLGFCAINYGTWNLFGGRWANSGSGKAITNYGNLTYVSVLGLDSSTQIVNQTGSNTSPVYQLGNSVGQYTFMTNYWNCNQLNLAGRQITYASSVPTTGTWVQGDQVTNYAPTELGSSGSKYIIKGWSCVSSGTPGTWVQERTLTGN